MLQPRCRDGQRLALAFRGWALGLAGHEVEAADVLQDLEQRRAQDYFSGFLPAQVSLGIGTEPSRGG